MLKYKACPSRQLFNKAYINNQQKNDHRINCCCCCCSLMSKILAFKCKVLLVNQEKFNSLDSLDDLNTVLDKIQTMILSFLKSPAQFNVIIGRTICRMFLEKLDRYFELRADLKKQTDRNSIRLKILLIFQLFRNSGQCSSEISSQKCKMDSYYLKDFKFKQIFEPSKIECGCYQTVQMVKQQIEAQGNFKINDIPFSESKQWFSEVLMLLIKIPHYNQLYILKSNESVCKATKKKLQDIHRRYEAQIGKCYCPLDFMPVIFGVNNQLNTFEFKECKFA